MESKTKFNPIAFEEYNKIRKLLLVGSEAIKEEVYRDDKGIATIGIGINIGGKNLEGLWLKLVLYYFFGLTKDIKDIPFKQFDSYEYTFKNIIKDTKSYKYEEYKTLIENLSNQMLETLQTDIKTSSLNKIIQNKIEDYTNEIKKKQQQNPKATLEELKGLNEQDLKTTQDSRGNLRCLEFKLTQQQAEELFNIMAINYEATTLKHFNDKNIHCFNKIKEKEENKKEYYKEFIPFLSASYKSPNVIANNLLLPKAFNQYQSRFLIWAILRYGLGSDSRRRILQSAIFNFNNKLANQRENEKEQWQTCLDIFKVLNLLKENTDKNKQTYLEYFKEQERKMLTAIQSEANAFKNRNVKRGKTNYLDDPNYAIYRSSYINSNELKPLREILNPYVKYLDSLISSAKFENNADFNKFTLESDTQDSTQESTTQSDSNLSRFKLKNIYVLDNNNYHKVLNAMREYNDTETNNKKENILLIITEAIHEELKIQKPSNTYLYIIQNKDICNTIDCSMLNNPLLDSIKQNDQCELFLYEEQEENKPNIISLATTTTLELQEQENALESKENHYTYSFDILNQFNIIQENQILFRLNNYRFYLEEINRDSNNPANANNNHSNENLNSNDLNHNKANKESNNLNSNQDSITTQANLESKDSTPSAYTLQTILQKDKAYSTLGIELKSPKVIDTFNNNGNFTIKLTNIHLKEIESQSNNTLTKDSPIFIYVQDLKLNFIAKLKNGQMTFKIPLDTTITKDQYNNTNLIDPKFLFLSFIPFKDNYEANNTKAQKIQIEVKDLEKQSITKEFKIPIIDDFKENEMVKEWRKESLSNKIVEVYFSYGEEQIRLQEYSRHYTDMNLHIITRDCKDNEEVEITLESSNHQRFTTCAKIHNNKAVIKNVFKEV